jgi:hypothetical protein
VPASFSGTSANRLRVEAQKEHYNSLADASALGPGMDEEAASLTVTLPPSKSESKPSGTSSSTYYFIATVTMYGHGHSKLCYSHRDGSLPCWDIGKTGIES